MDSLSLPVSFAKIYTRQPPMDASAYFASLTSLASQQRKVATVAIPKCSAATPNLVVTPTTTATTASSRTSPIADSDSSLHPKKVLVPIGYGTEEMEAIILVAVLRRAGAHVTVASVEPGLEIEGSGGTKLVADKSISKCSGETFDLVALPGGMPGSARLRDCDILREITSKQAEEKRLYGAICAAPAITLLPWGLLRKKEMTCHPAFFHKLPTFWAVKSDIQVSGGATTSRGPATSFQFALSLVEQLYGESVAKEIAELLLVGCTENDSGKKEFNEVDWTVGRSPSVLLPVANSSEEIEIVTVADILRRAKVNVVVASVERTLKISTSSGTKIIADKSIGDAQDSTYDLIILPGGIAGTERLSKSKILKRLLKEQHTAGRIYGAMCSSSTILRNQGLLKDKRATAHPSMNEKLNSEAVDGAKVVIDGNLITSRGLATVMDFALVIVSKLFGHGRARSVAEGLVLPYPPS